MAGDGPEVKTLQRYCLDNDLSHNVIFLGTVHHERIDMYYKMADIVLLPSTRSDNIEEATSLAMLEGMICKKVVIATAIGGLKEIIKDNKNGLLIEDKNSQQIAEAIEKVYHNKNFYESLSTNAYNYALNNHGYISHAQKFIEFYSQLIEKRV
ncbi:MAG TPA: glycosyltransferase [Thermodesulfovibrionia bacterium]|nr:glycosyltransferase [Thermodesulfovibrionia bacterium]